MLILCLFPIRMAFVPCNNRMTDEAFNMEIFNLSNDQ